jgi:Protein of unknown function (DUF2690)
VETAYYHAADGSRVGTLELYFSKSCGAAWARGESDWPYGGDAVVDSVNGGEELLEPCDIPKAVDAHCNTLMVPDSVMYLSDAYGFVLDQAGNPHNAQTAVP